MCKTCSMLLSEYSKSLRIQEHAMHVSSVSQRFFIRVIEFRPICCNFLAETNEIQPVYLSEVLQKTELGQNRRIEPNLLYSTCNYIR